MDGQALLSGSSQACRGRDRGRNIPQSGSQAVWGRDQHGNQLDEAGSMRPAASRRVRWAATSRRRFPGRTRSGCRSGSGTAISPYEVSLPSLLEAA